MPIVLCQKWIERERGWGSRPDGYSLHLSSKCRLHFIQDYWDSMPDSVPDEYSAPYGEPYHVEVDDETYNKINESKNLRVYSQVAPTAIQR